MVLQLGLAMIISSLDSTEAFTSGTTSFLVGSMRQAEELSITLVPTLANSGAHCKLVEPPAEKSAISGRFSITVVIEHTSYDLPLKLMVLPTDFSEATGISSVTGKFLSASTSNIFVPTKPVAPTTAIFT